MIQEMRNQFPTPNGVLARRLETQVFDLENKDDLETFVAGECHVLNVPFSDKTVAYDPLQRVGVALAKNDTSTAIAIGAYAFALHAIDSQHHRFSNQTNYIGKGIDKNQRFGE